MAGSGKRRKTNIRFPIRPHKPLEIAPRFPHSPQRGLRMLLQNIKPKSKKGTSRFALAQFYAFRLIVRLENAVASGVCSRVFVAPQVGSSYFRRVESSN